MNPTICGIAATIYIPDDGNNKTPRIIRTKEVAPHTNHPLAYSREVEHFVAWWRLRREKTLTLLVALEY